jgi:hypothetical protein
MTPRRAAPAAVLLALLIAGCSSMPDPEPTPGAAPANAQPPAGAVSGRPSIPPVNNEGYTRIVVGAGDSTSALPGTPGAAYRFRFRMLQPSGGSSGFNFQDRDLSFYFKPSPASVYFQIENRQNRPVTIDWEQSQFLAPNGQFGKLAHSTTTWDQRFSYQPPTTVNGLQRYGDYVFPNNSLVDPAGTGQQLHRVMLPEDQQAMQFTDRVFGMDLVILIEGQARTYTVRFKVDSVTPN